MNALAAGVPCCKAMTQIVPCTEEGQMQWFLFFHGGKDIVNEVVCASIPFIFSFFASTQAMFCQLEDRMSHQRVV